MASISSPLIRKLIQVRPEFIMKVRWGVIVLIPYIWDVLLYINLLYGGTERSRETTYSRCFRRQILQCLVPLLKKSYIQLWR